MQAQHNHQRTGADEPGKSLMTPEAILFLIFMVFFTILFQGRLIAAALCAIVVASTLGGLFSFLRDAIGRH